MDFDVVVFDTAPTGHTLRLLQFPTIIEKGFSKLLSLQSTLGPMMNQMSSMMGMGNLSGEETGRKLHETLETVQKISAQFKDDGIDTHNIIVNQLLFPDKDGSGCIACKKCESRHKIQTKYLDQIADLYEDFNVTKLPLLEREVRGPDSIKEFSENLVKPYDSSTV